MQDNSCACFHVLSRAARGDLGPRLPSVSYTHTPPRCVVLFFLFSFKGSRFRNSNATCIIW